MLERLDFNMLIEMDSDGDGIDTNEYCLAMLRILELVDEEKIEMLHAQFAEHDKDGSGRLDANDLALIAKEKSLKKRRKALTLKGVCGPELEHAMAMATEECDRQARETVRHSLMRRSDATIARMPGKQSLRKVSLHEPLREEERSPTATEEDKDAEIRSFVDETIRSAVPTDSDDRRVKVYPS